MKKIHVVIALLLIAGPAAGQSTMTRENTLSGHWPQECRKVEIISSLDQTLQAAYFYRATGSDPRPLIVSLHTWSNGYDQQDTLAWMAVANNYNYIHPDFRGPNNRPEACGSALAIRDIEDAIGYALLEGQVDSSEIHVIGVSGGGYATLLTYMKTRHPVKTFSAWAPISNLVDWYYESVGRKQKYARDIARVTNPLRSDPENYTVDSLEARRRSPIFMPTPVDRRTDSKLFLYAGIHDGYTGSVPITQSLRFFNKVVQDFAPDAAGTLIQTEEMLSLVERRNTRFDHPDALKKGAVHFRRQYRGLIQVTVFEGTHEMLPDRVLDPLDPVKILAIGDSNGALDDGWVNQLRELRFKDRIYNTSISGNTIGFDNLGRNALNTLSNVDQYLEQAAQTLNGLDKIVIMLGTNDCKAVFDDSLSRVPDKLAQLITKIKSHHVFQQYRPQIYIVSPPPYAPDEQLNPKYYGGAADIAWLYPHFKEVTEKMGCTFIDTYSSLLPKWGAVSEDGIHLKSQGQKWIAAWILETW